MHFMKLDFSITKSSVRLLWMHVWKICCTTTVFVFLCFTCFPRTGKGNLAARRHVAKLMILTDNGSHKKWERTSDTSELTIRSILKNRRGSVLSGTIWQCLRVGSIQSHLSNKRWFSLLTAEAALLLIIVQVPLLQDHQTTTMIL